MFSCFKTLLLVVALYVVAHGKTLPYSKDTVTSLLTKQRKGDATQTMAVTAAAAEAAETTATAAGRNNLCNLDKTVDKRTPSSAVQDWSLVCQQLCGAALGGAACSSYCKNMPVLPTKVQMENADNLLDSKQSQICPNLCGLQLGDDVCTCQNSVTIDDVTPSKEETNVCAVFCDYNNVTLAGCSPCPKLRGTNDSNAETLAAIKSVISAVVLEAAEEPATTSTTTTTPNWSQLCVSLCKTGDGGSLCNCDLSPFFV